ncbi:hypothetical protein CO154_01400 [Candidatus Pacearchaeota archaeon CG_4_9_14_3_um_filter_31_7]|nr:MAG: hypothetical protein AUJ10_03130 [Candidatus Pacearchaeota archaeon CG1_02_31_27]PIN92399.1 MAG: hypothetical protein COU55_01175 [Candidatus Pacearchaeota archaeon CG10_big_fil_rev_8_21_14_0_10_31_59]PIZ80592.1 MAG: hypothetical protein COX99_02175 [Candidatus Pacearchaeota archaeon CG_4_10_14_0_2_um_filter_31_10]PJA70712.1 MAG: hypothetical protein CO154_01400 [Candidatus Pacearchaeota archaeon CG_4_9_14_3_um_filter_31_7]
MEQVLIFADYILIAITFIYLIIASVTDIKRREVPNWLSFSFIILGLAVRAIACILIKPLTISNYSYLLYGLAGFLVFVGLGIAFYYGRIFSGGDAKLLMGIGAAIANMSSLKIISSYIFLDKFFIFQFVLNLLLVGLVYTLIFAFILTILKWSRIKNEVKNLFLKRKFAIIIISSLSLVLAVTFFILRINFIGPIFLVLMILPWIYVIIKPVQENGMIYEISVKDITEGEWLAEEIKIKEKIIKYKWDGINEKELKLIKENFDEGRKIKIKKGVPFIPVFLIAFILTFIFGNLFLELVNLLL